MTLVLNHTQELCTGRYDRRGMHCSHVVVLHLEEWILGPVRTVRTVRRAKAVLIDTLDIIRQHSTMSHLIVT